MSERDVSDSTSIRLLGSLLTKVGLPHALIGGYAVNFHSEYRATLDFDLCVFPDRDRDPQFEARTTTVGLACPPGPRRGPYFFGSGLLENVER